MKQSLRATARLLFAACFCCALAFYAGLGRAEDAKPTAKLIKLAVFDLELDDFSAGGPLAGESAEETARLRRVTALAREQLAKSGLFELVDTSASSDEKSEGRIGCANATAARPTSPARSAPICPSSASSARSA